ncbi:fructosamine kinase family protein [Aldersonia kunmingensis]|uniref:fructosamine kinase family protein n=1 Tax=Aldersonia kunmingensis TaxID=408066 RepID=UPI001FE132D3|nr:fructosamine kinase family protein [Aldersonia kunmingensis]
MASDALGRGTAFRKSKSGVHPDFYPAEAAGLRWLADGGARVVDVLEVGSGHIDLALIGESAPSERSARELGEMLARMHDAGVNGELFGCPPAGFAGQLFIGARPMSSTRHSSWGEFYAAERVLPFVRVAVDGGSLGADGLRTVERACDLGASGAFDDGEPPARIHGDLWNGNVLWTRQGAVLIDPAAHGGHRETDLAMLALFGLPFLHHVIDGYQSVHRLRVGWEARVLLHQLHPLAVHTASFGGGYARSLSDAARAALALA